LQTRNEPQIKLETMKIEYKGFIIDNRCLPSYAKFCYYKIGGGRIFTASTIEECKQEIDELW
jgi:hypothetical protein